MNVERIRVTKEYSVELNDQFYLVQLSQDEVTDTVTRTVFGQHGFPLMETGIPEEIKKYTFVL